MEDNVLQWLISLHIIICSIYLLFFFRKGKIYKCFFPVVVFFPHVWTILFLIGRTIIYEIQRIRDYDRDEIMLPGSGGNSLVELDKEKETNIVPVEEALLLNEYDIKRKMVIEVAKRNPSGYLEKLKMALLSEDTETAHYAASSISHLKRINDKDLRLAKEKYEQSPERYKYRDEYIQTLDRVIKNKLSVDAIIAGYKDDMIDLLECHINIGSDISPDDYNMLIEYILDRNKLKKALKWIEKYENVYPDSEKPLVYELKVHYLNSDRKAFDNTVSRIYNAGFSVSQETLDMIEFWKA